MEKLLNQRLPPRIKKFSPAKQRLLDKLLDKHSEGDITPLEKIKLEKLVAEAEKLVVENTRRLAQFAKSGGGGPPEGAVPVTVWIKPEYVRP